MSLTNEYSTRLLKPRNAVELMAWIEVKSAAKLVGLCYLKLKHATNHLAAGIALGYTVKAFNLYLTRRDTYDEIRTKLHRESKR